MTRIILQAFLFTVAMTPVAILHLLIYNNIELSKMKKNIARLFILLVTSFTIKLSITIIPVFAQTFDSEFNDHQKNFIYGQIDSECEEEDLVLVNNTSQCARLKSSDPKGFSVRPYVGPEEHSLPGLSNCEAQIIPGTESIGDNTTYIRAVDANEEICIVVTPEETQYWDFTIYAYSNTGEPADQGVSTGDGPLSGEYVGISANPIFVWLVGIINVLSAGVGIIVVTMIVVGGLQYMFSGGNPQTAAGARTRIYNALMALGLFLAMWAILNWLIPGGLLNGI